MTIVEEVVVVISEPKPAPPPMWHRLCCLDFSKTICGITRKSKESMKMTEGHSDCIVCDDLWDNDTCCPVIGFCPHHARNGGHDFPFDLI